VLGRFDRRLVARQDIHLVFSKLNGLPQDASVYYNGMAAGRVKSMRLQALDDAMLKRLPPFKLYDLDQLPLSDAERTALRDQNLSAEALDQRVREMVRGRNVSVLRLDLAKDGDVARYRVDDEYQITGSLTGDRALAIRSGSGAAVPDGYDTFFLGNSGDIYTDLGKSVEQVRDILNSMAEAVGGDSGPAAIQGQLANFDLFTRRIEETVGGLETEIPETWDAIEARLDAGAKQMDGVGAKLKNIEPDLQKVLNDADKTMADLRGDVDRSLTPVVEQIKEGRKSAKETLTTAAASIAEAREKFPAQIRDARTFVEGLTPSVNKIENAMESAALMLDESSDSTRSVLGGAIAKAQSLEELSFRLKTKPHAVVTPLEGEEEKQLELRWKRALMERQYDELRGEIERMRKDGAEGASLRLMKVEQVLKEIEAVLQNSAAEGDESKKRKEKR
jgi:hypothetical protein